MSKKTIIILSIIVLMILAAGAFFAYKKNLFSHFEKESFFSPLFKGGLGGILDTKLTPENLLSSFEIKNPNLSAEQAHLFQQRFDETKKRLQENPDSFNDWLYLGVLKKGVGDYEGARDVWLYGAEIRPKSSTPFANLADLYAYFLNEPAKAEEALKKAIANDPNDYNFLLSLADLYRYKMPGREALAEQTLLEAVQKFPDNPNVIAPLASYYRQTNQIAKAIEYYEKLLKLTPNNETARQDLEELKTGK